MHVTRIEPKQTKQTLNFSGPPRRDKHSVDMPVSIPDLSIPSSYN
jgi:hypothetical protein